MAKKVFENPIDEFLDDYTNKGTIQGYRQFLNYYFKVIGKDPKTYFTRKQDYETDIKKYWKYIIEKSGHAPNHSIVALSVVKLFHENHGIIYPRTFWKKLRNTKKLYNRALTQDRIPKNYELKQILSHANSLERAFFLMQCSSGLRMNELLKLEFDDIDLEHEPPMITLPGEITKNNLSRTTFISYEAKEYFNEYLKVRKEYLRIAVLKSTIKKKSMQDPRLFPYHSSVMTRKWQRLLRYSKFDKKDKTTGIRIYHDHVLRKFFETRMDLCSVPAGIVQSMQGHIGYLDGSYKRYEIDDLAGWYLKAMPSLTIFSSIPDLTEHDERLKKLEDENTELRKITDKLARKYLIAED
jgi:integrase